MQKMMNEHLSRQFELELDAIRTNALQMGGYVEQQLENALAVAQDWSDKWESDAKNISLREQLIAEELTSLAAADIADIIEEIEQPPLRLQLLLQIAAPVMKQKLVYVIPVLLERSPTLIFVQAAAD